jgi:hypothetical protein
MNVEYSNQFIRETNISRQKTIEVFRYLEKQKNHILYFDISGNIMCLNDIGFLYETSLNTVYDMIQEINYSQNEIEYSKLVQSHLIRDFRYLLSVKKRKLQCIFSRIFLRLKQVFSFKWIKTSFKMRNKKLRIFELLKQVNYMELIK